MSEFRYHNPDLILEVSNSLGIEDQGFVEKDLFVTKAIEIISRINTEHFKPVFAGGTCLAKAHKLINRISEDVDFKISQKEPIVALSKEATKRELKTYHNTVIEALENEGMRIDRDKLMVRNERKYAQIQLTYPSLYEDSNILRPHVLVELTASNPRVPTSFLSVNSMVGEYLNTPEKIQIECVSILETAAEKWVALTRQTAAVERGIFEPDRNIVRHLYDLHEIEARIGLDKEFIALVIETVKHDAKQFEARHQQYSENPLQETENALKTLRGERYRQYYEDYVVRMVIDREPLSYQKVLESFEAITEKTRHSLAHLSK